jgi:O-antigen/teichoic acid export membrane protein
MRMHDDSTDRSLDELRAKRPTKEDIGRKAMSGAAFVAGRNVALLALAFAANIVLARELSPRQFGLVAFGMAITAFASTLANGGIGGALVSSAVPIDEPTLKSVLGLEILITTVLFALIAAVTLPFFGLIGQLTALMALSMPIEALETPATIVLERSLEYRTLARVEVLKAIAYYAYAVTAVSLGMGVWGLATAVLVRAAVSVGLYFRARRDLFFRPTFSVSSVRPLLPFGIKYQATAFVTVVRDQGLNVGVSVIAGTSTLGIWMLAQRILQLPFSLFQTLWRVSFPATSQLIEAGADARRLIHRGAKATAIGTGIVLGPLAAAAPALVPSLFGARWHEAGVIVPVACIGLIVSGPVSVATAGFLWASGDASAVLSATAWHSAVWLATTFSLLPIVGPVAIPVGWTLGAAVDVVLLIHAAGRHVPLRIGREIAWTCISAELAGAVGLAVTVAAGSTFLSGVAGAVVALFGFAAAMLTRERSQTLELLGTLRDAVRSRRTPAAATANAE